MGGFLSSDDGIFLEKNMSRRGCLRGTRRVRSIGLEPDPPKQPPPLTGRAGVGFPRIQGGAPVYVEYPLPLRGYGGFFLKKLERMVGERQDTKVSVPLSYLEW